MSAEDQTSQAVALMVSNPLTELTDKLNDSNTAALVTIFVGSAEEKHNESDTKDVVKDISDIVILSIARLDALGDATFSSEQYVEAKIKLKELKDVVAKFDKLLERSNTALLNEKAQLMKRLEEISRVVDTSSGRTGDASNGRTGDVSGDISTRKKSSQQSWADKTDTEEKQSRGRARTQQWDVTAHRGNSPADFDQSQDEHDGVRNYGSRGRGNHSGFRGRGNGKHRMMTQEEVERKFSGGMSDHDTVHSKHVVQRERGSYVPPFSKNPLNRRVVPDDIEGFAITIQQHPRFGPLITFARPFHEIMIGGAIEVVPARPVVKPNYCKPLYLEGLCNCETTALVLHADRPLYIGSMDFVGILHKFINSYNGNLFHPFDRAKNHVDAHLLRCVIHAIMKLKGVGKGPVVLTISSFADATEPRNMLNAISDYYNGKDVDPMSVARGLFVAVATHFVSS